MKIENVPVEKISIGERFRTAYGDLEALAGSIHDLGLLQPIGVDQDYNLVYGCRRLYACERILKWPEIPCIILNINSVLAGEFVENEFRKQFTSSERTAIGKALEDELRTKERRGNPKLAANAAKWVESGRALDIAAHRAGFNSAETFERAKKVVEHGTPELIAAMDAGEVSINAAAKIATQTEVEQTRIVQLPKDERRTALRKIHQNKLTDEEMEDLRLYRGLYDAVRLIADVHGQSTEIWEGLWRACAIHFNTELLDRAISLLSRLRREHPNAPGRPRRLEEIS